MPVNFAAIANMLREREGRRNVPQAILQMRIDFANKNRLKKLKAVKDVNNQFVTVSLGEKRNYQRKLN